MFSDVSELIAHNPPALHYGVAVTDTDGDDRLEFVVAGFSGPNRVLRWQAGKLRDAAPPEVADPEQPAVALAAADLDGDGREELYIHNTDASSGPKRSPDRLLDPRPDGRWEDLFDLPQNRSVRNYSAGRSVAALDRRGVGRYGFVVASHGLPMRFYELSPGGSLADLAPSLGLDRVAGGRGLLTLPLFSDHPDIFCVNEYGPNFAFRNRGDGTFVECAQEFGLDDPDEHARGVSAFDPGGDGTLALCWGNWDGPHRLMYRRPNRRWCDGATPGLAFPSAVRNVIAADFDNDGNDELFFNNFGEPNRLFRATPGLTMLDPGEAVDADGFGTGAAVCDIDGDGVLELLIARGELEPQSLGVYKVKAAARNGWLRVRPLTRFGAPARGAVVRAEVDGRVRVKAVCGGSGYLSQMEPVAHFGFGSGGPAERLQVMWPDGTAVVILNPGWQRTITVPYPRG
jgi:hypothetical protein